MSPFELPNPSTTESTMARDLLWKDCKILKKARQIALEDSMVAGDSYKRDHDAANNLHDFKEGDYAYLDNQLFLGKNKILLNDGSAPKW